MAAQYLQWPSITASSGANSRRQVTACVIIKKAPSLPCGMHSYIHAGFGYINAYIHFLFLHWFLLLYVPSLPDAGFPPQAGLSGPDNCSGSLKMGTRQPRLSCGLLTPRGYRSTASLSTLFIPPPNLKIQGGSMDFEGASPPLKLLLINDLRVS